MIFGNLRTAMLSPYARVLRDERGSALIDSMVGVIITAIVVSAVAALAVSTNESVNRVNTDANRATSLRTLVNVRALQPAAVTFDGVTADAIVDGSSVPVTVWKTAPTPGTVVIHAATSSDEKAADDVCSNPSYIPAAQCVEATVTVNLVDAPAPVGLPLTASWLNAAVASGTATTVAPGVIGSFDATGKATVRYVVKLGTPSGPGTVTFWNGSTILGIAPYDSLVYGATPGYVYGALAVSGATTITVKVTGGSVALSRFNFYEVPR